MVQKKQRRGLTLLRVGSLKKILRDLGLQSTGEALVQLDRDVNHIIKKYGKDQADQGIKRLNGDTSLMAITGTSRSKPHPITETEKVDSVLGKSCQRCSGIKDAFLQKARAEMRWFYDEIKTGIIRASNGKKYNPDWATKQGRINNIT